MKNKLDKLHLLNGAYDIHIHAAPDLIPRAMDLRQLCLEAEGAGMAGILLKDHCTSTVGRVAALNLMSSGTCRFFSALALNPPVGSLNPTAVEAALRAGTDVIYFPTYGAAHHIAIWGAGKPPTAFPLPANGFAGTVIIDDRNDLKPEALEILKLIAEYNAILATGHISAKESLILLPIYGRLSGCWSPMLPSRCRRLPSRSSKRPLSWARLWSTAFLPRHRLARAQYHWKTCGIQSGRRVSSMSSCLLTLDRQPMGTRFGTFCIIWKKFPNSDSTNRRLDR